MSSSNNKNLKLKKKKTWEKAMTKPKSWNYWVLTCKLFK
jgi:hypothetical protein